MVAAVCPQLKGKYQCCSDDYFNNARLKLKNQDLRNGFSMQAQPRVTGFRSLQAWSPTWYTSDLTVLTCNRLPTQINLVF